MKITAIVVWQVDLPLKEGRYNWAKGKYVEVFDSTVVEIQTDAGISGYGECCPLGPVYLPSFALGVRAGIKQLAPHLLGLDPRELGEINRAMDGSLRGHPYAKSPLDIACWDILGKFADMPVYQLLGGAAQGDIALYRAISQLPPEEMTENARKYREEGYHKIQLKVGGNPQEDIERIRAIREMLDPEDILIADANTGWKRHEAARVVDAVADLNVYIEQPCLTYGECLSIRRRTRRPMILDEVIDGTESLVRALADDAMDVINLKISKVGGLSKGRVMRDLCVDFGIPMTIEDSWGSDITTAAFAHLAKSTREDFCFSTTDLNAYNTVSVARGAPVRSHGKFDVSDRPGLGVEPDFEVLADPVLLIGSPKV